MGRRRYANLDSGHRPHGAAAIFRWLIWDPLTGRRRVAPAGPPAPRVKPDRSLIWSASGPARLTWIGHASFLGRLGGAAFLIDPVFSPRVGLVYRRHVAPGLFPEEIPPLDALLITHNHYDHLDAPSLKALPRSMPVVVPRGLGRWFARRRWPRVVELGWWESVRAGRLTATLVPACHWSRRRLWDTNRTHWGGYVVAAHGRALYLAGDTAWFDGFAEIGRRFPGLLAAVLPIGGYLPVWFMEHNHMNPEQAGRAFQQLGARHLVAGHWGTFQLTDEPLSEPAARLQEWWQRASPPDGRHLHLPAVGETVVLEA